MRARTNERTKRIVEPAAAAFSARESATRARGPERGATRVKTRSIESRAREHARARTRAVLTRRCDARSVRCSDSGSPGA